MEQHVMCPKTEWGGKTFGSEMHLWPTGFWGNFLDLGHILYPFFHFGTSLGLMIDFNRLEQYYILDKIQHEGKGTYSMYVYV